MNICSTSSHRRWTRQPPSQEDHHGFTLVEIMVAAGVGSLVLTAVAFLSLYGARSSVAVCNYTDLDARSRYALDVMCREIRQATAVTAVQPNLPIKSLTFFQISRVSPVSMYAHFLERTLANLGLLG